MTAAVLAALLAAGGADCHRVDCHQLADDILPAASRYQIPPLLMAAVVIHESRGRHVLAPRRYGFDVGAWQIRCPVQRGGSLSRCLRRFWGHPHVRIAQPGKRQRRAQALMAARILARGNAAGGRRW